MYLEWSIVSCILRTGYDRAFVNCCFCINGCCTCKQKQSDKYNNSFLYIEPPLTPCDNIYIYKYHWINSAIHAQSVIASMTAISKYRTAFSRSQPESAERYCPGFPGAGARATSFPSRQVRRNAPYAVVTTTGLSPVSAAVQ